MNHQIQRLEPGLYLVATPIGTARDITLRALDVLASADVVVAEDTRALRRLMDIHGVPLGGRPMLSYHDHSGAKVRGKLLAFLAEGRSVAYASEAGTPLIADPGYHLSREAAEAGYLVTAAPGPSAIATALCVAGLPTDAFFFAGFLPNARAARRAALEKLAQVPGTLLFYESPKRLAEMLKDAARVLGGAREAAICRELTKRFEEVRRGTLGDLAAGLEGQPVKGEVVVVVDRGRDGPRDDTEIEADLARALETMSVRDAAESVARAHDVNKRKIYQLALKLSSQAR